MPTAVKLPRLGQGMEAGTVVKWLKAEGDRVERGEPLYELDTEKVTQEVEAEAAGVLLKIVVPEGEVAVGTTLAFIGEAGEQVDVPEAEALADVEARREQPAAEPRPEPTPVAAGAGVDQPERREDGRVKASPLARRLAREQGIDLAAVSGTGPEGRIVAEDVERATAAPAAPAKAGAPVATPGEAARVPLTSIRRTIARRLTEAWEIPVFQLQASADMTAVNRHLERRRALDPDVRLTVTDVLIKVCAAALMRHPEVNSQYTGEAILRFPTANVGLAVATERGLMVPVVHGAERLSLAEIAAARADVVGRAREGHLRREDVEGGTFTISNLGMFRVERFTAVLNPPEAAILAVGAIEDRVVPEDGELVVRPTMMFVGTFDHRAVDGAPAAQFLESVNAMLEDLSLAL